MNTPLLKGIAWGLAITFVTVVLALLLAEVLDGSDDGASPLACYEDPTGQTREDLEAVHGPGEEVYALKMEDDGTNNPVVYEVVYSSGAVVYYESPGENAAHVERTKPSDVSVGYDWTTMEVCSG